MTRRLTTSAQLQVLVLYAAFTLTGVATALLGAALPAMLAVWHLSDRSGGWLLFSSFAGATVGASLVRKRLGFTAVAGLAITGGSTLFLGLAHHGPFVAAFFLYGLGLGFTMTAISTLRSRQVPAAENHLAMSRLNLIWALGACFAPALALRSLHRVSVGGLFRVESVAFLLCAVFLLAVMVGRKPEDGRASHEVPPVPSHDRLAPLRMCVFAAAAVGLESAIGGWLTTYTAREAHGTGIAVWANSAFWVGLLLSRGLHSLRAGRQLHGVRGVTGHLAAVSLAAALLIAAPAQTVLPLAAFLAGFGLGPLYPLVLSMALPHYRSGAVFVMAGVGASLLPWLTGVVSSSFRSLRLGLVVPCLTVLILLLAALSMRQEIAAAEQASA